MRTTPIAEALALADAVFVGELTAFELADSWWGIAEVTIRSLWAEFRDREDKYVDAWEDSSRYGRVAQLRILERFKGTADQSVSIHTGFGSGDCGYQFTGRTKYLVYAYWETDTTDSRRRYLGTSICSRTAPVDAATQELAELKRLTHVSGR